MCFTEIESETFTQGSQKALKDTEDTYILIYSKVYRVKPKDK